MSEKDTGGILLFISLALGFIAFFGYSMILVYKLSTRPEFETEGIVKWQDKYYRLEIVRKRYMKEKVSVPSPSKHKHLMTTKCTLCGKAPAKSTN